MLYSIVKLFLFLSCNTHTGTKIIFEYVQVHMHGCMNICTHIYAYRETEYIPSTTHI